MIIRKSFRVGLISFLFFALWHTSVLGQKDDLMIIEYVDTEAPYNDGYGIKVYNPTGSTIDMSNYYIKLFHNGNGTATITEQLSGSIDPDDIFIIGNDDFCSMCAATCDFEVTATQGVNENDVVAITSSTSNTFVDMVGPHDANVDAMVADTPQALLHHKLIRKCDNDIRYVNSASASGPGNNSWYNSSSQSMPGWEVNPISCFSAQAFSGEIAITLPDTVLCAGDSAFYDVSTFNGDSVKWYWSQDTSMLESLYLKDTGEYIVQVFASCGGKDTFLINRLEGADLVDLGLEDTSICLYDTLVASVPSSLTYDSLEWSFETGVSTSDTLNITDTGIYILQMFAGCGGIDTFEVSYNYPVIPEFTFLDDTICMSDSFVTKSLNLPDVDSILWRSSAIDFYEKGNVVVISQQGEYKIHAFTSCNQDIQITSDTFSLTVLNCDTIPPGPGVEELSFPNIVTPNGDGINDVFYISGINTLGKSRTLEVYNRWGRLVYESSPYQNDWEPEELPDGTYYFAVTYIKEDNLLNVQVSGKYKGYFLIAK